MTKLTPLERKIVKRAAEYVSESDCSLFVATHRACRDRRALHALLKVVSKFYLFYDRYDSDIWLDVKGEQLRTTRVLLLLTFLHFDGVIE